MNPWTHIPHRTPGRFRIGDRVRLRHAFGGVDAEIIEDHGPIGVGRRRLYTVLIKREGGDDDTLGGYPEDDMEPLAPADGQTPRG